MKYWGKSFTCPLFFYTSEMEILLAHWLFNVTIHLSLFIELASPPMYTLKSAGCLQCWCFPFQISSRDDRRDPTTSCQCMEGFLSLLHAYKYSCGWSLQCESAKWYICTGESGLSCILLLWDSFSFLCENVAHTCISASGLDAHFFFFGIGKDHFPIHFVFKMKLVLDK